MGNALVGAKFDRVLDADEMAQQGTGFGLGDRYTDDVGNEYVFVKAGGTIGASNVAVYDEDYEANAAANDESDFGALVGVAQAAMTEDDYGWLMVKGITDIQVAASAAANVQLATTTTAGQIDDATGAGTKNLVGIILTTARGSGAGTAPGQVNFPYVGATNSG